MNVNVVREKNTDLKKHINTIHCSNNLTLVQRKLFNALLYKAYPTLLHQTRFQIQVRELCDLIGYNSNDYAKLKKSLLGLITIVIEWNIIDYSNGTEKNWKASSILASAELTNGVCLYEYSHIMKELLYQPEIYGKVSIKLMSKFKSNYGLALYENCIRYQGLPQTPWFPLDVFRKLMGVTEKKYIAFKDFKKRVLNVAVDEVNRISPINIIAEIERKNQKVVKIRFKLIKSTLTNELNFNTKQIDENLYDTLMNFFGFSENMINQIVAEYNQEYLESKVGMVMQSESFHAGKIRDLAGYLVEALRKNYQPSKSSKQIIENRRRKKEEEDKDRHDDQEKKEKSYSDYVGKKINTYLKALKKDDYDKLISEFENHISEKNIIIKWYKKYKFEHPGVKSYFYNFIKENRKYELGSILSLDDFKSLISEYT